MRTKRAPPPALDGTGVAMTGPARPIRRRARVPRGPRGSTAELPMMSMPTILLLDEEPILRRATALMLTNRGGEVSAAGSPAEAVALAERRVFDLAILDVVPGGSGAEEILGQLRTRGTAPRRVIVCSPVPVERQEAKQFTEVLLKPYSFERLLRAVFGPPAPRPPLRSGIFPRAMLSSESSCARSARRWRRRRPRALPAR
jgi:CheY-like chemotaxis protein